MSLHERARELAVACAHVRAVAPRREPGQEHRGRRREAEHEDGDREPVAEPDVDRSRRGRGNARAQDRGDEQAGPLDDAAAGIDDRALARDGRLHDPPSRLDRAQLAHDHVLARRRGLRPRGVVRAHDDDAGSVGDEPAHQAGERVLEADGGADRDAVHAEEPERGARLQVHEVIPEALRPSEQRRVRDVFAERDEVELRVARLDLARTRIEQDLVAEPSRGRLTDGAHERRGTDGADRRRNRPPDVS